MRDAQGTPVRVLGVIQAITDRKRTEAEFTESETRWHAVFDNSGIGIVLIESAGFPIECNRAFEQMLGYTEEELRHILFTDLLIAMMRRKGLCPCLGNPRRQTREVPDRKRATSLRKERCSG